MEFLVRSAINFPSDMDKAVYDDVMAREIARGKELIDGGHVRGSWRVIGRRASITVFEFPDANALHDVLINLPVYPYTTIESVEPLASHPSLKLIDQLRESESATESEHD